MIAEKAKRVLVTGCAGFIGSNVVGDLLAKGWNVLGLDNFFLGTKAAITPFADCSNWEFWEEDVCRISSEDLLSRSVTHVVHLAAIGKILYSVEYPEATHRANVVGTLNLIQACLRANIKRVVFSSSSSVYGTQLTEFNDESLSPQPISPYAIQKLECEDLFARAHEQHGLEAVVLRLFNVFGPGQGQFGKYTPLIPHVIKAVLEGKEVQVRGDGGQTRDFTYVQNVADAVIEALVVENQSINGSPINIGTGIGRTVNQVIDTVSILCAVQPVKTFGKPVPEAYTSIAALGRAERLLNYSPRISFEAGLSQTIKTFDS